MQILETNEDIVEMRKKFVSSTGQLFREIFNKGFLNYQCGEWELARDALGQTAASFWSNRPPKSPARSEELFSAALDSDSSAFIQASSDNSTAETPYSDGPSLAILEYMKHSNVKTWKGVRHF
jgi:hypothetical protein